MEKVNRLISRMREDRERVSLPTAGDVVTYTTRGGDYYPQAHIERGDDREVHICLLPQTPFCHENEKCTGYNTEGGPWVITGPELLLPDGIRSKQFRMWGHTGRHRNGAVLFHTFVRAWKYTEPDPLYGKYTTKEWTRYIIECQPDIEPADAFIYRNESFTLYSREELERLVGILHGELFNGFRPGLFILWAYRMEWKELPTWEWNMLKAETHLFFLGVSPVKIRTDHNGHTVTFYKKQNNMTRYETSPEVRPLEKTICEFAGLNGYDPMNVFTDFLRYVIHGFSPGAPPLKDWRYKRQQNAAFMKMFAEWVRLMQKQLEAASWYDALGDLFMALSSRKGQQAQGQFFTPVHICDLMVMCTETDEKRPGRG